MNPDDLQFLFGLAQDAIYRQQDESMAEQSDIERLEYLRSFYPREDQILSDGDRQDLPDNNDQT